MKTKCLISCENEVMVLGLSTLLRDESDLECVGVQLYSDTDLKPMIEQYRPDVLVIDRQNRYYPNLFCLLSLVQYPDLVVIVLEIDQNQIQIHRKGEMVESSNSNLISAILNRGSLIS